MKDIIKREAASFIKDAKLDGWTQEAHNAFVARLLKREIGLEESQVESLMQLQSAMGSLTSNASAFRQWLESKDVALLKKADEAKVLGNRYAGIVTA